MENYFLIFVDKFIGLIVWEMVGVINIGALFLVHFSPIANIQYVKNNRGLVVFIYASFIAIILNIWHIFTSENFKSLDFIMYQFRLLFSYMLSVVIYHAGGIKWVVNKIKNFGAGD